MKRFITVMFSLTTLSLLAAEFDPFDGPQPIAVLIQTDPWAMVIGADTPRVAVYEDGMVIFLRKSGKSANFHRKDLSASELSDFKKRLTPTLDLKDLNRSYSLSDATDQPQALFYIRDAKRELTTSVYGLQAVSTKPSTDTVLPSVRKPGAVPNELRELHKFLCTIEYSDSKEWTPRYLEVMVWPYEYAPDASITWPKDWPDLDSKRSFKRRGSYSIFLDGSALPELQKFLQTRKAKGAVKIGNKKWAVSFRYVIPSEPVWRRAFESSPKK